MKRPHFECKRFAIPTSLIKHDCEMGWAFWFEFRVKLGPWYLAVFW